MRWVLPLLAGLVLASLSSVASAHPVAQGAMEITVHPDRVDVHVRAANEEAFVADAFSDDPSPKPGLEAIFERHAVYLLHHVTVAIDGATAAGKVAAVDPAPDPTPSARADYFLQFALPNGTASPNRVVIRQDVLNELEFAPGNRWEATYVVKIGQVGRSAREGLLLTAREPVEFTCDWKTPASANPAPARLDQGALFAAYLRHGIMHILTGYDHMLFMCALVLAVISLGDLVKVVTAFTLAHTITLTLAVLNIVRIPSRIVEPMIAASIVFVALQNIFWPRQTRGWSRLLIAFGFGLFHGLGFAGGLMDAMSGLPGIAIVSAIIAFSLGVEIGHQFVVLPLFAGMQLARRASSTPARATAFRAALLRFGSAAVCLAGMVYLVAALRG